MTDRQPSPSETSIVGSLRRLLRRYWNDLLSVYYANTPIWRVLKSVSLLFFGFFCWSAAALLLSYRPEWTFLYYVMAYGFVLILWGPLTHFVIVPLVIRLRRTAEHPVTRTITRHGSKLNLSVFIVIVIVLGTAPISPMLLDFGTIAGDDGQPDVNPDLLCTNDGEVIECELSDPTGIDHVVVTSGERELTTETDPPFAFEIHEDDLVEVVGQKQFVVELRDEDGETLRRYARTAS